MRRDSQELTSIYIRVYIYESVYTSLNSLEKDWIRLDVSLRKMAI